MTGFANMLAFLVICSAVLFEFSTAKSENPTITIFTSLLTIDEQKKAAIQSWLRLPQVTKIVLIGRVDLLEQQVSNIKKDSKTSIEIEVEDRVDTNLRGRPLFNSIIYRTLAATTDIAVYVNADVHLLPDVIAGINHAQEYFPNFVAMAARWDIDDDSNLLSYSDDFEALRNLVLSKGTLHAVGGVDLWAYNVNTPLLNMLIPPFTLARGRYDNWLVHELITSSDRATVDMTEAVTLIHRNHERNSTYLRRRLLEKDDGKEGSGKISSGSSSSKTSGVSKLKRTFETFINTHLALHYGSYQSQKGTSLHIPRKMTNCLGRSGKYDQLCFIERVRPGVCNCEYSSFVTSSTSDPHSDKATKQYLCGKLPSNYTSKFNLDATLKDSYKSAAGIPHTLSSLLLSLAEENTIILTAATYAYREVIMSWVCNLKKLKISSFVVAALDPEMYKYLYVRGVPVYFEDIIKTMRGDKEKKQGSAVQNAGCDGYYSECFKLLTKLKSRTMVKILKLGYDVVWSDSDIVWFKNPLPTLFKIKDEHKGKSDGLLIIQSNEPNPALPLNGIRRINSGFYLATATSKTVERMDAVIERASKSKLTEQPNFYDELCGSTGEYRVQNDQCFFQGMRVVFLDTALFPNGGVGAKISPGAVVTNDEVGGIWNSTNIEKDNPKILVLHNNWVVGIQDKLQRQINAGLFYYDTEYEICKWEWTTALHNLKLKV